MTKLFSELERPVSELELFVDKLREGWMQVMAEKTGFGRNELKAKFEMVISSAMMQMLARDARKERDEINVDTK